MNKEAIMKTKRCASLLLAIALLASAASGCSTSSTASSETSSSETSSQGTSEEEPFSYPVEGNPVLTYFGKLHSKVSKDYSSYADLEVVQWWFEQTGVTLEFETPPSGMEEEQFNILLASGDYPDLINYDLVGQPGGTQKLYNDGVIIDLTDDMQKYMPNLLAYYEENPDMERQVKDDNGRFFVIPFLKGGGVLLATTGPMIRQDILEEVGVEPPETIAEWDTALSAMKEAYPDSYPLTGRFDELRSLFQPAYGVGNDYWYEDTEGKMCIRDRIRTRTSRSSTQSTTRTATRSRSSKS